MRKKCRKRGHKNVVIKCGHSAHPGTQLRLLTYDGVLNSVVVNVVNVASDNIENDTYTLFTHQYY